MGDPVELLVPGNREHPPQLYRAANSEMSPRWSREAAPRRISVLLHHSSSFYSYIGLFKLVKTGGASAGRYLAGYASGRVYSSGCGGAARWEAYPWGSARFSGGHRAAPDQRLVCGPDRRWRRASRTFWRSSVVRARAALFRPCSRSYMSWGHAGAALAAGGRAGLRGRHRARARGSPGLLIGSGAARIGAVVLVAMAAAVFLGARPLVVNQAAISAVLVVVLQPPGAVFDPARFLDALAGGSVALAVELPLPRKPRAAGGAGRSTGLRRAGGGARGDSRRAQGGDRDAAEGALCAPGISTTSG